MATPARVQDTIERQRPVDPASFKSAMRQLVGGVTVITAGRGQDISGMTVTSFASFTADPPSVVVSVNRESSSWPLIERYRAFGANVLASGQLDMAKRFTSQSGLAGATRFQAIEWRSKATGAPLLVNSLVSLDCELCRFIEFHSHMLLVGNVVAVDMSSKCGGSLAYWNGQYVNVDSNEELRLMTEVSIPTARALREI
ncbi:MAG TPA: flavin reductase family protein [Nitrobacter sp.]|nr:flavin reductase family protein [Nitrobacter sp.]